MEKHGYRNTPTYFTWINMKRRCNDTKRKDYHRYGGRGITVCTHWLTSFIMFLKDMGERPKNMTLDRIDNSKSYCKKNCKWATTKEQQRNTRQNRFIKYKGKALCLAEWAENYNINVATLSKRLKEGWSVEKALTTKLNFTRRGVTHNKKMITYRGVTKNIKEWATYFNIKYQTLHKRITKYDMPFEKAVTQIIKEGGSL